ncbi:hypothetical protein [Caballeronia grimmiae]|uniref:hypothetical protein n=1 Tax=Caballeronia grimmiae TaxID=1071679 RepID=UPI0038B77B67
MRDNHTCDAVGVLRFLWDKFDANTATDEELEFLSCATDEATTISHSVADELFGIAVFVGGERQAGRQVEKINGIDLPVALINLSQTMRMVGELTFIGSEASFEERKRSEAKLKSRRVERAKQSEREDA